MVALPGEGPEAGGFTGRGFTGMGFTGMGFTGRNRDHAGGGMPGSHKLVLCIFHSGEEILVLQLPVGPKKLLEVAGL